MVCIISNLHLNYYVKVELFINVKLSNFATLLYYKMFLANSFDDPHPHYFVNSYSLSNINPRVFNANEFLYVITQMMLSLKHIETLTFISCKHRNVARLVLHSFSHDINQS